MGIFNRNNEGYSRGGMDVESAVNLFFKGVLLFPVFLFAGYIGITMMKHMIFHGIPSMNRPTPEQNERLREQDSQIGSPAVRELQREESEVISEPKEYDGSLVKFTSPDLSDSLSEEEYHRQATEAYHRDLEIYQMAYRNWVSCVSSGGYCEFSGVKPSFANYYQL